MKSTANLRVRSVVCVFLATLTLVFASSRPQPASANGTEAAWISLSIENGQAGGSLDLIAGQAYVFQRLTLAVDNRQVKDSREALEWLRHRSDFSSLDWNGVRESRAHWRNFHESRPAADLYSHVFEGAKWMGDANGFELSVLDAAGKIIGSPLRLTNNDFLNAQKQQDFDMVKAEYRYERFARHKDLTSAKTSRAVARIVLAVQTSLDKPLVIPANAHSLRVVWDKKPQQPYTIPIRLVPPTFNYGGKLHVKLDPEKPIYAPGDIIRATFTVIDQKGQHLKFSEYKENGIRQINIHLDGPVHNPTFYHEEWLSEFGKRNAYHLRAPILIPSTAKKSLNKKLKGPPLSADGTSMIVDLHVPKDLPKDQFGTFQVNATLWRNYASQTWADRFERFVQVGQQSPTHFPSVACESCHAPNTPMDIGLLIPPMVGVEKLKVDNIDSCVMCHDNSRGGSRRLSRFLHLIHENREKFTAAGHNCTSCHGSTDTARKGNYP